VSVILYFNYNFMAYRNVHIRLLLLVINNCMYFNYRLIEAIIY